MDTKYKPRIIQPENNVLYGPVKLTDWAIGGLKYIDTKYEYSVIMGANTDKRLPTGWIDAYATPILANYGSVRPIPGGITISKSGSSIKYPTALERARFAAATAMNQLKAAQYTTLELTQTNTKADSNFPVILLYNMALIRNTYAIVMPLLHYNTMMAVLKAMSSFNVTASYRVDLITRQINRARFQAPLKSYLDMLANTPIHTSYAKALEAFMVVEKLNNASNTSFDYVKVTKPSDWSTDIFTVTNPNSADQSLLLKTPKLDAIEDRLYINRIVTSFAMSEEDFTKFIENETLWNDILRPIKEAFTEAVTSMAALPIIFAPYYSALDVLQGVIDPSVFAPASLNMADSLRQSSYLSSAYWIRKAKVSETSSAGSVEYPTYDIEVPLIAGNLKPSAAFDSNGVLMMKPSVEGLSQLFSGFVDLDNLSLQWVTFISQLDLSELEAEKRAGQWLIPVWDLLLSESNNMVTLDLGDKTPDWDYDKAIRSVTGTFLNYVAMKVGLVRVHSRHLTNKSFYVKSPLITGVRQVTLPSPADQILEAIPRVHGIKPTIPMAK